MITNALDALLADDRDLISYLVQSQYGLPAFDPDVVRVAGKRLSVMREVFLKGPGSRGQWCFRWDCAARMDVVLRELGYRIVWDLGDPVVCHGIGEGQYWLHILQVHYPEEGSWNS